MDWHLSFTSLFYDRSKGVRVFDARYLYAKVGAVGKTSRARRRPVAE